MTKIWTAWLVGAALVGWTLTAIWVVGTMAVMCL